MNRTVYTALFLAAAGAIAYMIYQVQHPIKFTPAGNNFDADDAYLYNLIRADYQAWAAANTPGDQLAWFDDLVLKAYGTSYIAGHKSKAAAYVNTYAALQPAQPKRNYYLALLDNLKKKYTTAA